MEIQQDFFKTYDQCLIDTLKQEIDEVKKSSDRVRKGLFARHNELSRHYLELKQELDDWKRSICRGETQLREVI